ncbi:MAG: hypothetical protein IT516_05425 [Burkholderiales bacterium]|nr:hypothetical protein [Burkholderiales bacterium]
MKSLPPLCVMLAIRCVTLMLVVAAPPALGAAVAPAGWPRHVELAQAALLVYSPQVVAWDGDRVTLRSAIAVRASGARDETFGTLEATASAHVDKGLRKAALQDLTVTRIDVPALPDRGASLVAGLNTVARSTLRFVSLDRLQASLAGRRRAAIPVAVDNTPPRIIVATAPAILVPIDGTPVWRAVAGSPGWSRVINTRALILKSTSAPEVFLRVHDGWLMADTLAGPWSQPFLPPAGIEAVARKVVASGAVDPLSRRKGARAPSSSDQTIPAVHVTETPAELIVFRGAPDFVPLVGTTLTWASNTTSDVLRDTATAMTYVLLAGRWFRAPSLAGPWAFVASDALPADFARIPATSLAGAVLAAVAGTPQARDALAENALPQTATVPRRGGPAFTAVYDGAPQFAAEPGTTLMRAVNAPVPIVRTAGGVYYALKAGIWFTATQANGPWSVATSVAPEIYTIPPTSPLHFATYVRIYGVTPDAVFMGYTPGYLGTVVGTGGTVAYGTGYTYRPWLGERWYPAPATYGLAATPVFNARVGYSYGFATGLTTPADAVRADRGARFHPAYWGSNPCCATTSANVYRAWFDRDKARAARRAVPPAIPAGVTGSAASAGPQVPLRRVGPTRGYDMDMITDADAAPRGKPAGASAPAYISANAYYASLAKDGGWTPATAVNETYAGDDGAVYRQHGGAWQRHDGGTWSAQAAAPAAVAAEAQARASVDPGMVAGSYAMSNATRFLGRGGDGWSARDRGDGGYSRTLGGDGGISAERANYDNQVMDNAFNIAMDGGWWGESTSVGNGAISVGVGVGGAVGPGTGIAFGMAPGLGWGGRFGAD